MDIVERVKAERIEELAERDTRELAELLVSLEDTFDRLLARAERQRERIRHLEGHRDDLQKRCTELVLELRGLRAGIVLSRRREVAPAEASR